MSNLLLTMLDISSFRYTTCCGAVCICLMVYELAALHCRAIKIQLQSLPVEAWIRAEDAAGLRIPKRANYLTQSCTAETQILPKRKVLCCSWVHKAEFNTCWAHARQVPVPPVSRGHGSETAPSRQPLCYDSKHFCHCILSAFEDPLSPWLRARLRVTSSSLSAALLTGVAACNNWHGLVSHMAFVWESLEGSEGNKEETDAYRLTVREVEQKPSE